MLSLGVIRLWAGGTIYSRGKGVFENNKVHALSAEETDEGYTKIEALVNGSGGKNYRVAVTLDADGGPDDHQCTCPAHASFYGPCKHCAAVLLEYMERQRHEEVQETSGKEEKLKRLDELVRDKGVSRGISVREKSKVQPGRLTTTPGLNELISQYTLQNTAAYLPGSEEGTVKLEPYIEFRGSYFQVEFKIGSTRMYVLKSISKMAAAIENLEMVTYGAQLSFLHSIGAFEPSSRRMAQFLVDNAGGSGFYYRTPYGRYQSYADDRYMNINKKNVDAFMEALGEKEFYMTLSQDVKGMWQIERKLPPWDIEMTGTKGGVCLKMNMFPSFEGRFSTWYFYNGIVYEVGTQKLKKAEKFFYFMSMRTQGKCQIADTDIPGFCQNILPALESICPVKKTDIKVQEYLPAEAAFEIYLDLPQKDMVSCRLLSVYGEDKYNVFRDARDIRKMTGRDVRRELEAEHKVKQFFMAYDETDASMVLQGADAIYEFLTDGIMRLQDIGEVYVSDRLKAVRILPSPKVAVGVSLLGGVMELDLECETMSMEELAAVLSKYDRKKKYFRMKNGDFLDMDEDGIRVINRLQDRFMLKKEDLAKGKAEVPTYRALYLDEELRQEQSVPFNRSRDFKALIRNMKTIEDNDFELPKGLNAQLREYQKRGFLWIKTLARNGFGGILADDMGLGKTLQVITFLLSEFQEEGMKRTLIVAPASLVYNWQSEFERFAPTLPTVAVTGTPKQRQELIEGAGEKEILITSYDLLRRDIDFYQERRFFCEVLDEAQFIKNHATQGARSVKQVNAVFRLALTGTPVENTLSELWSIFDYLMPGFLYSYSRFREQLESPIVKEGDGEAMQQLQKMIRPFILRRLKKDVLKDLPDKIEKVTFAQMTEEQKQLYDAHVQRIRFQITGQSEAEFEKSKILMLAELTKLRQLCCDPMLLYEGYKGGAAKLDLCMELVENAVAAGHKILLFSQFTSMLELITGQLAKKEISYYTLTGSTSKEKRRDLVEQFNTDDTSVFCISLKAGGTGLNLTAADIVIHYDPWWNAAAENQATDRAHRIGQKNVVTVYKLVARETIEERIIELQSRKRELADQVLAGEELKSGSFTREELLELLGSMG